ncbi:hypothetical protein BLA29_008067 [Euroglyphus maynei]|uniref:Uncharacterized protein n=1 Tax=Euroglyphus maynei TaxID=6958 RepID=A0A1Y3BGJ1_EURMA|nr:hypothetical protein BLA29_008067 [Euroglyphus maynei]
MQREKDCQSDNDLSWDNLYDDNGDIINDLNDQFETINIKTENIQKSELDYSKFLDKTGKSSTDIQPSSLLSDYKRFDQFK